MNHATEEEPGKILHEMRFGASARSALGVGRGLLRLDRRHAAVRDAARRAAAVGPRRRRRSAGCSRTPTARSTGSSGSATATATATSSTPRRSRPDSRTRAGRTRGTAIRFADGTLADAADRAVRGAGLRVRGLRRAGPLRREAGDDVTFERATAQKARELQAAVQRGLLARRARLVRARPRRRQAPDRRAGLQHGPLPVDRHRRRRQAPRSSLSGCMSPEMFSGWGVRTLATSMAAYNPVSYHNGSVWPHDNAICAAGPDALRLRGGGAPRHRARSSTSPAAFAADGSPSCSPASRAARSASPAVVPHVVRAPGLGRRRRRCSGCALCCASTRGPRTMRCGSLPSSRRGSTCCGSRGSRSPASHSPSTWKTAASMCAAAVTSMCCATPARCS